MNKEIRMPRLGINDDYVLLGQWTVKDGAFVSAGTEIAVLETTKETSYLEMPEDGYISIEIKEGTEAEVDKVIAHISEQPVEKMEQAEENGENIEDYQLTEKAKELVKEYQIDLSLFPKDRIIREKEVLKYVKKPYTIAPVMSNKVLLYGGGGFGKTAIDILVRTHAYEIAGIVDARYPELETVMGIKVLGRQEDLEKIYESGIHKAFNGVGFNGKYHYRKELYDLMKGIGFELVNIIHERAVIEPSATIGEGNLIFPGAMIGSEAIIGSNCIINANCVISHNCVISDHCHVSSGTILAGNVLVGENTLIGQGCTVYRDVKIGSNVVIQNGVNVFHDVPDGTFLQK